MADFKDIALGFDRMCNFYSVPPCEGCPMGIRSIDRNDCMSRLFAKPDKYEGRVLKWIEEHPEPVYPTWIEWLKSIGVIPYMTGLVVTTDGDGNFVNAHLEINENAIKEMPIDIVKKLELKPVGSKE